MNFEDFRSHMASYRRSVDEEARSLKDSNLALERISSLYRSFDANERAMANRVLAEWVLSADEALRFDALAIIDDFKISMAADALKRLARRLTSSAEPSAPYELQKVERILNEMAVSSHRN